MMLARSARLGPYEIQAPLGHGGMGEVYRATDTRLDRIVALKVLPPSVTDHPARRQRFEREARALASLSHPHICPLYDVGEHDGVAFLVMEYLDGETLAARLGRGALPLDQVVSQAIDIADALDHAHRHGVIHRDLKPSNVMVTRSGVKVLDFGIARLCAAETIAGAPMTALTTQTIMEEGTIVGTPQYMAPEQLEQRATDARADIFAFGAVVYEMATGGPAFEGESQASLIAAILTHDPPPLSLRLRQLDKREGNTASRMPTDAVPPQLDHAIAKCLAKDPDERWQNASDMRQVLKWIAESRGQVHGIPPATAVPASRPMQVARLAVGALIVSAAVALGIAIGRSQQTAIDSSVVTFEVSPPEDGSFSTSNAFLAVAPDGRSLAFASSSQVSGANTLWIRSLDSPAARKFPGFEAAMPFWSPDSRFLAASGLVNRSWNLIKLDVSTGLPQTVSALWDPRTNGPVATPNMLAMYGTGAWNPDGIILKTSAEGGLARIAPDGGPVTPMTTLDRTRGETDHLWPHFLPDRRHFLYHAASTQPQYDRMLYVASLNDQTRIAVLQTDSPAVYTPPGYLLFMRGTTLVAQPFDATRFRVSGEPVPLAGSIDTIGGPRGTFSASQTGVLAYRQAGETELVWFDRAGRSLGSITPPGYYRNPALSPDEQHVAVATNDPINGMDGSGIWIVDAARGALSRFASDGNSPLWTPDGARLVFDRGSEGIFVFRTVGGTATEETLERGRPKPRSPTAPLSWLPAEHAFLFSGRGGLWKLPLKGDRTPVLVRPRFDGRQAQLSPDGRWLAYASLEAGRYEVTVEAFPSGERKWRVSVDGGLEPQWRRDGRELYFLAPDKALMSVAVKTDSTFEAKLPERLFNTRIATYLNYGGRNQYVVSADGQRFLINQVTGQPTPITVVVNWPALLKK